jgi:hypothetical protein
MVYFYLESKVFVPNHFYQFLQFFFITYTVAKPTYSPSTGSSEIQISSSFYVITIHFNYNEDFTPICK